MKLSKRLLRNNIVQKLICSLIAGYINLVYYTSRWTIKGQEFFAPYNDGQQGNAIFAFWHGRLLMMPKFRLKGRKWHIVISVHNDGEIIARAVERMGVHLIRGSSRKGGVAALMGARNVLQEGGHVGITPDGPKGPRMRINSNIVALAKMTGKPIIPVTFSSSRAIVFNSWDRFLLALPFGKGILICGEPIVVDPDCNEDAESEYIQTLEAKMNEITAEADRITGITHVEPAAPKD